MKVQNLSALARLPRRSVQLETLEGVENVVGHSDERLPGYLLVTLQGVAKKVLQYIKHHR